MSKSFKNVVDPEELFKRYGRDLLRYFFLREVPLGEDGDFRSKQLIHRYNGDLANDLGNLVSRIHGILERFASETGVPTVQADHPARKRFSALVERVKEYVQNFRLHLALGEIWSYIGELNEFVDRSQPWKLKRENRYRELRESLATLAYGACALGVILDPFLPDAAQAIRSAYGVALPQGFTFLELALRGWDIPCTFHRKPLSPLFPRLKEEIQEVSLMAHPESDLKKNQKEIKEAVKPQNENLCEITIEEFHRVELRVGVVIAATRVSGSDKLIELKVDLGEGTPRTIVAGIAPQYEPDDLLGKKVVVVANLKPKRVWKRLSQGMILAGEGEGGLRLLEAPSDLPPGTRLK